jgi:autotransporter-associated beta strand protein
MVFSSTLTGSGILNLWSPYVRADLKGNWSAFSGTINVTTDTDGGDFRITNSNGYANALVTLASKVNAYPNGTYTVSFGSLSSTAIDANVTTPFTVGNRNTDAVFAGIIKGTGALSKTGTGSWTINNVNTYTGATSVDGGTLMVENTTGSATGTGSVTVKSGAVLGGSGIISGTVNILSGGTISAGSNAATGSISIGTNLVIATGGIISADVNADTNAADVINVNGISNLTGTVLKINKLSGTYNTGDSFKLINCPTITSSISQVIPETPGTGLKWDLSELNTSGTIKVAVSMTAMKDVTLPDNILIYPNPCTDKLNISLTETTDALVKIADISGLLFYQAIVNLQNLQVSLADYPRGLYIIEITKSDYTCTYKVVKI